MHYAFDEDQETYAQEVRKFAVKTLAPNYQSDDQKAEFRRQLALDIEAHQAL